MQVQKYRVLEELGSGGMGKVYKGLLIGQSGFQRPIVMKQLRDAEEPDHVRLFVDEARRYAVLDHENIGRIFDFENVDGKMCIILEYIDGWSLVEYLERHGEVGRRPDIDLSVFIASRVCRALQYVFEQSAIVHRDVSPSNIMMTREGTVKLIDFGIATRSGTRDSSLTGKPAYMAPEMVVELRADNRSDLYSLGAVLFEMLTLSRLFDGETTAEVLEKVITGHHPSPLHLNPDIPDGVLAILRTALQRDPASRYASAGEMGAACEHYLYDKGYGPTNLSLKKYVGTLFPAAAVIDSVEEGFPVVEPTLLPISDPAAETRARDLDRTPPARRHEYTVAVSRPPAEGNPSATVAANGGRRPRRIKTRSRPS
jgi:serine/threonine-protein kinase